MSTIPILQIGQAPRSIFKSCFSNTIRGAWFFGHSRFRDDHPVPCSCADYCSGACFAASCATCRAGVWSYPGGEAECFSPGPLGTGLLCATDAESGALTDDACCRSAELDEPACAIAQGSCCESGDCSQCSSFPPPIALFPSLQTNRRWDNATNTCMDISSIDGTGSST